MKKFVFLVLISGYILILFTCLKKSNPYSQEDNQTAEGNTYYVSINGSNGNNGSRESPWASPGYASRQLSPGDTLIIQGGTFVLQNYDTDIIIPPDGTADHPITIRGEQDNRPVLAGRNNLSFALALSSHLIIKNFEITSHNRADFREAISQVDRKVTDIILEDLYIHHLDEFGIDIADVDNIQIHNCIITHTGFGSIGGPVGAISGWTNVTINNCQLSYNGHYYQGGKGPSPYDRPDGFGIEPSNGPIEIKYTTAEHNRGDGLDSKASNTFIHHCFIANNACDGIKLWSGTSRVENCLIYGTGDGIGGPSPWAGLVIEGSAENDSFEIINVTIHDNPSRQAYSLYVGYDQLKDFSILFRNCIVANGYGLAYFGPRVTANIDHCLFFRANNNDQVEANNRTYTSQDINSGLLGSGNISRPPEFVFPAWGITGDYHLRNNSPAIDRGTSLEAPGSDLDNNSRPQGNGFDMGAYEYLKE